MKTLIIIFLTIIFSNALYAQTVYQTYTVTGIETWDLTTHPNGVDIEEQLIIENGALLTINDLTVRFDPYNIWDGNIDVKSGGKLAAYNTTFTSRSANIYWNGIRVRGNPAYPYHDLNQQGLLLLDNSNLIGAHFAVLANNGDGGYPFTGPGGGTTIIRRSVFKDCNSSIHISESPLGYAQITGSSFLITQNYPQYQWPNPNSVPIAINLVYTKV
ncbi:MAG: hypothetical protein RBR87_13025 [Bacteroidales bacterium]|jgi:hypothetical protein|nr:hypothetical protein [Bacteroidales bacterium]